MAIDVSELHHVTESSAGLNTFKIHENQHNFIEAAKKTKGLVVVNIRSQELAQGREHGHLVLGLIWQIVKASLLQRIAAITADKESKLEDILLHWVNDQISEDKKVSNLSSDMKNGRAYLCLLQSLAGLEQKDDFGTNEERASEIVRLAKSIGIKNMVEPDAILSANPKLNLLLTASIWEYANPVISEDTKEMYKNWVNKHIEGSGLAAIANLTSDLSDSKAYMVILRKLFPETSLSKSIEDAFSENKLEFTLEPERIASGDEIYNCHLIEFLMKVAKSQLVTAEELRVAKEREDERIRKQKVEEEKGRRLQEEDFERIKKQKLEEDEKLRKAQEEVDSNHTRQVKELIDWMNSILEKCGCSKILNLDSDLKSGVQYVHVLKHEFLDSVELSEQERKQDHVDYVEELMSRLGMAFNINKDEIRAGNEDFNVSFVSFLKERSENREEELMEWFNSCLVNDEAAKISNLESDLADGHAYSRVMTKMLDQPLELKDNLDSWLSICKEQAVEAKPPIPFDADRVSSSDKCFNRTFVEMLKEQAPKYHAARQQELNDLVTWFNSILTKCSKQEISNLGFDLSSGLSYMYLLKLEFGTSAELAGQESEADRVGLISEFCKSHGIDYAIQEASIRSGDESFNVKFVSFLRALRASMDQELIDWLNTHVIAAGMTPINDLEHGLADGKVCSYALIHAFKLKPAQEVDSWHNVLKSKLVEAQVSHLLDVDKLRGHDVPYIRLLVSSMIAGEKRCKESKIKQRKTVRIPLGQFSYPFCLRGGVAGTSFLGPQFLFDQTE